MARQRLKQATKKGFTIKDSKEKAFLIASLASEKKALDTVILELKNRVSYTDYCIICSGISDRQVQAIAGFIEESLKNNRVFPMSAEGYSGGKWILLDYDDVVIHVFYHPTRLFYDLEGLWMDVPRVELKNAK